jgi:hypothetical protein
VLVGPVVLDAQGDGVHATVIPSTPAASHRDVFAQGAAFAGGALLLSVFTVTHTQ